MIDLAPQRDPDSVLMIKLADATKQCILELEERGKYRKARTHATVPKRLRMTFCTCYIVTPDVAVSYYYFLIITQG